MAPEGKWEENKVWNKIKKQFQTKFADQFLNSNKIKSQFGIKKFEKNMIL